jgi:hypothetical protein
MAPPCSDRRTLHRYHYTQSMAIEAFLGTRPQKAFLFTICCQAVVVLAMVGIVYGEVYTLLRFLDKTQFAHHGLSYQVNANFSEADINKVSP